MAQQQHIDLIKQGAIPWNRWIKANPEIQPDLSGVDFNSTNLSGISLCIANLITCNFSSADLRNANLSGAKMSRSDLRDADLRGVNLRKADLSGADLRGADLRKADLSGADLSKATLVHARLNRASLIEARLDRANLNSAQLNGADLSNAHLYSASLKGANLRGANLLQANLCEADCSEANLMEANLMEASLMSTNFAHANLNSSRTYGIIARNLQMTEATQLDLIITSYGQSLITIDNLKLAQFVSLLLENQEIYGVISTIKTKLVLIAGRFPSERQDILQSLRDELRKRNYVPIVFTIEEAGGEDFRKTVGILARIACFSLIDSTDGRSIIQELQAIFPDIQVLVQPLLAEIHKTTRKNSDIDNLPLVFPINFDTDQVDILHTLQQAIALISERGI